MLCQDPMHEGGTEAAFTHGHTNGLLFFPKDLIFSLYSLFSMKL